MSTKKSNMKRMINSGKRLDAVRKTSRLSEEEERREKAFQWEEHQKASQIKNDLLQNIDKLHDSDQMQLIYALRNSIEKRLDAFERKIQTRMAPEEKKKKYRNLFDENGYGTVSKTSGVYYTTVLGNIEDLGEYEVHIDEVDWKNVIGVIDHYEYGEIPQVLVRSPALSFFGKSNWEIRRDIKESIQKRFIEINAISDIIEKEQTTPVEKGAVTLRLKDLIGLIDDDIDSYKKIGYDDEVQEEEEKLVAIRKKYDIWT